MATPYCGAVIKQWEIEVMFLSYSEDHISRFTFPPVSVNARPSLRGKTYVKTALANDRLEDPCQINPSLALFFFYMCSFCF